MDNTLLEIKDLMLDWKYSILSFCEEALDFHPTTQQKKLFKIVQEYKLTACKSGHGTGKSTALSAMILWYLICFDKSQVVVTANRFEQIRSVIWHRMSELYYNLPKSIQSIYRITSDRIINLYDKSCFAVATTSRPENCDALQGYHADNLLIVVDEAASVKDGFFLPIIGSLTGSNNKMVLIGNPTRNTGFFYNCFVEGKNNTWATLTFNAEESTLVSQEQIYIWEEHYGKDSDEYRVRVLGEFPNEESRGLFGKGMVEAAMSLEIPPLDPILWGVDIAAFGGDETVIAKRYGNVIHSFNVTKDKDVSSVALWIEHIYKLTPLKERPILICIDTIGIGSGVYSILRQNNLPVREVVFSRKSSYPDKYSNLRSELFYKLYDMLDKKILKLPLDHKLKKEMLGIKYFYDTKGRYQIDSKKKIKSQFSRSPDRLDAVLCSLSSDIYNVLNKYSSSHAGINFVSYQTIYESELDFF